MVMPEPKETRPRHPKRGDGSANPYHKRWGWWYSAIADYLLANPGCTNKEIAAAMNKAENTISMIRKSDTFRDYYAQRKADFQERHDFSLREKMHKVAEKGLDCMLGALEKRGDQVPLNIQTELVTGVLDRLGYGPKSTPVQVNVQQNDQRVQIAVSPEALEEARRSLRQAQHNRRLENADALLPSPPAQLPSTDSGVGRGEGAGPTLDLVAEPSRSKREEGE